MSDPIADMWIRRFVDGEISKDELREQLQVGEHSANDTR
jgi:hypothetical protein